ncbi:MAG: hypothetical protein ACT4N2_04845 [Hyphomicrobium sp.]
MRQAAAVDRDEGQAVRQGAIEAWSERIREAPSSATAGLLAALVLAIYNLAPLLLGTDAIVERVPDDAFYYLVLARNFATEGWWTFDGQHAASGFHILYGYLLAGLYWLAPDIGLEATYLLVVLINTALIAGSVYLLAEVNRTLGFAAGNTALVLVALSAVGVRLPGFPMEACFAIFFSAAAFSLLTAGMGDRGRAVSTGSSRLAIGGLAVSVGVLGVLSRSDWGAMPFALLAGLIGHMWWHGKLDRAALRTAVLLCIGALAGEVLVALHTHAFTGAYVQKSASIKHFWAETLGYTLLPGIARVIELSGPAVLPRPVVLVGLAIIGTLLFRAGRVRAMLDNPLVPGCLLIIAGYIAVYALNGSVQYWYSANFFAAVAVLLSAAWAALPASLAVLRPLAVGAFVIAAVWQFATPPWTWAPAMVEAGRTLRGHPEIAPVGAWNAGILSYFMGRPVVNLDGLVNDSVYPYVVDGRLHDYVAERGITNLVDFPTVLTNPAGRRGGMVEGRFAACSTAQRTFAPERRFEGVPLTHFRVDLACLTAPIPAAPVGASP